MANEDIDLATARVRLANIESDLRASRRKTASASAKSTNPKVVNKNTKVSQAQIDQIKKLGMTKALQMVKDNKGSVRSGAVEITNEAVRRLYGQERFDKAMGRVKRPTGSLSKSGGKSASGSKLVQPNPNRSNVREGRVEGPKPKAKVKTPMTPYQKDMARRGIY